jgi:hypothetical protein
MLSAFCVLMTISSFVFIKGILTCTYFYPYGSQKKIYLQSKNCFHIRINLYKVVSQIKHKKKARYRLTPYLQALSKKMDCRQLPTCSHQGLESSCCILPKKFFEALLSVLLLRLLPLQKLHLLVLHF